MRNTDVYCTFFLHRDKRVDFRQAENIKEVVLSHKMDLQPGCLSAYTSSKLQYEVRWTSPREIRWLDCSTCPPQPVDTSCVTHIKGNQIYDMCCFMDAEELILVATQGVLGLHAYDTFENEVVWTAKGRYSGMEQEMNAQALATDELGHLFVSDSNNTCIHVISTDRKQYLGTLVKEENQDLAICWCKGIASLLVAYTLDRRTYHVNLIRDTSLEIPGVADKQTDLSEPTQEMEDEIIVDVVSDLEDREVVPEKIQEDKSTKEPIEETDLPLMAETAEVSAERTNQELVENAKNASEKSREDSRKEGGNDLVDSDTTEDIDVSQDAVGEATEECSTEIPREVAKNGVVETVQLEVAKDLTEIVQKGGTGDKEEPQKGTTEDITETHEEDISVGQDRIQEDTIETQEGTIEDISVGEDAIEENIIETQEDTSGDISVGEDAIEVDVIETQESITQDTTETQEATTEEVIETQEDTTENISVGQEGTTEDINTQVGTTQRSIETQEGTTQIISVEQSTIEYVNDGQECSADDSGEAQDGATEDAIKPQEGSNQDTNKTQEGTSQKGSTEDDIEAQEGTTEDIIETQEGSNQDTTHDTSVEPRECKSQYYY